MSRSEREKMLPWLIQKVDSGDVPGLHWLDKEKTKFRVTWKHAGKPDFNLDQDAVLFRMWAEHTGKYKPGEQPDPSTWKTRFRCALRKQPDIMEIPVANSLDESEPYRVFRLKNKVSSSKTLHVSTTPSPSPDDVMEVCSYPATFPYSNNGATTGYEFSFPSPMSSLTSSPTNSMDNNQTMCSDDDDIDNIIPTLPPLFNRYHNSIPESDVSMPCSPPLSHGQMVHAFTGTDYITGQPYSEPLSAVTQRSDYYEYVSSLVTTTVHDGISPMTSQQTENTNNFAEQNGLAAQLGFLIAMFGPAVIQEMLVQQTPVNVASTNAYRDMQYLDLLFNPTI